jgi:hypothetical protein
MILIIIIKKTIIQPQFLRTIIVSFNGMKQIKEIAQKLKIINNYNRLTIIVDFLFGLTRNKLDDVFENQKHHPAYSLLSQTKTLLLLLIVSSM